jgi:acyl-coenzyme A thioesterase 9
LVLKHARGFTHTTKLSTDGVFKELTAARVQTPWIEAFRKQQAGENQREKAGGQSEIPAERDLKPKRMSDSYHSVVGARALFLFDYNKLRTFN